MSKHNYYLKKQENMFNAKICKLSKSTKTKNYYLPLNLQNVNLSIKKILKQYKYYYPQILFHKKF